MVKKKQDRNTAQNYPKIINNEWKSGGRIQKHFPIPLLDKGSQTWTQKKTFYLTYLYFTFSVWSWQPWQSYSLHSISSVHRNKNRAVTYTQPFLSFTISLSLVSPGLGEGCVTITVHVKLCFLLMCFLVPNTPAHRMVCDIWRFLKKKIPEPTTARVSNTIFETEQIFFRSAAQSHRVKGADRTRALYKSLTRIINVCLGNGFAWIVG